MTRDRWWWVLALLALALGGWWLSTATEWADRPIYRPRSGEARTNPVYETEQLLRKLGLHAEHRDSLDPLPPPQARLVLMSDDWSLIPGRAEQLHAWVRQGGHLVVLNGTDWSDTPLKSWVPVDTAVVNDKRAPVSCRVSDGPASAASSHAAASDAESEDDGDSDIADDDEAGEDTQSDEGPDEGADEGASAGTDDGTNEGAHESTAPAVPNSAVVETPGSSTAAISAGGERTTWRQCGLFGSHLRFKPRGGAVPVWQVLQGNGVPGLRIQVERGTVTVLNITPMDLMYDNLLDCDHAVLMASALQAEPGGTVWFYLSEKREFIVPWLWHRGWIAVLLAMLTLTAALWRRAVRFGPRMSEAPRLRRSIAEQVRGLGHYLHRHGSDALMAAEQRALEATAAKRLNLDARLPVQDRARRIAKATGLPEAGLIEALSARFCSRADLPSRVQILEQARRRLQTTPDERHPR